MARHLPYLLLFPVSSPPLQQLQYKKNVPLKAERVKFFARVNRWFFFYRNRIIWFSRILAVLQGLLDLDVFNLLDLFAGVKMRRITGEKKFFRPAMDSARRTHGEPLLSIKGLALSATPSPHFSYKKTASNVGLKRCNLLSGGLPGVLS
jgi:hypothetical protein